MQADAHDLTDAGRRHERATVVELHPARDAVTGPQPLQPGDHPRVGVIGDDLDPRLVRGDVDLVERMETHPTLQMPGPDQVDLDDVARRPGHWCRVRNPFRHAPPRPPPPRRPRALQHPLDRAHRRHDRTELLKLPRHRRRTDLRPRVLLQPRANVQHPRLDLRVGATRDSLRRTRPAVGPAVIERVIPRRPLRDPLPRTTQIQRDRPRRLARQPPPRRLPTQRHLDFLHPDLPARSNEHQRLSTRPDGSAPSRASSARAR